jgi:MFS family permease
VIKLEEWAEIRRLHLAEGVPIKELARRFGLSRNTVRSAATALTYIQHDLGLPASSLQWVVNTYSLFIAGFLLLGGRAADLFGRRRVLLASLGLLAAGTVICAGSPNLPALLTGRSIQGMAAALAMPAALALLGRLFAAEPWRSRAFSVMSATGGIAGIAGAVIGGVLTGWLGWHWVFLGVLPVNLIAIVLVIKVIPGDPTVATPRRQLDITGAILATAGFILLVLAFSQVEQFGFLSLQVLLALAAASVLLTLFVWWERRARTALIRPVLLRSRRLIGSCAGIAAASAIHSAVVVLGSMQLQHDYGFTPMQAGFALAPALVATGVGSLVAGVLVPRLGSLRVALIGLPVAAGALGLWSAGAHSRQYATAVLPWLVLQGLANSANYVALTRESVGDAAEEAAEKAVTEAVTEAVAETTDELGIDVPIEKTQDMLIKITEAVSETAAPHLTENDAESPIPAAPAELEPAVSEAVKKTLDETMPALVAASGDLGVGVVTTLVDRAEEAIEEVGDEVDHGAAAGIFEASTHVGGALAVAVLITFATSSRGFGGAYAVAAGMAALGWLAVALLIPAPRRAGVRRPRRWSLNGRARRQVVVSATRGQLERRWARRLRRRHR